LPVAPAHLSAHKAADYKASAQVVEDFHQFDALTRRLPDVLRDAFYTAYQCARDRAMGHHVIP